ALPISSRRSPTDRAAAGSASRPVCRRGGACRVRQPHARRRQRRRSRRRGLSPVPHRLRGRPYLAAGTSQHTCGADRLAQRRRGRADRASPCRNRPGAPGRPRPVWRLPMKTDTRRLMMFAAALVFAVLAGYGLAKLTGGQDAGPSPAGHVDGGDQGEHGDEEAEGEEGLVVLTQPQIEASGIQVVALGRGGGGETRLSGRVESAVGARAAVAASVGGRVERVVVAPGPPVRAGQPLAVLVSGGPPTIRASGHAARAQAQAARLGYQRDQSLVTQGVVARQELEASRARSLAADATARAAAAQVAAAGSPDAGGRATSTSPVAGIVG